MTTAKWINPPSLEGRKGVVEIQTKAGSTVNRALSKADCRQPEHYRLQLAVAETWSPPLSRGSKTENNIYSEGKERSRGRGRCFPCPGTWEINKFDILWRRLEETDQGQAWGYYRSCYHGNQNLEADARTTEGGRAPLTSIPDTFPSRFAPWREVHGLSLPSMSNNFNRFQTVWAYSQNYQLPTARGQKFQVSALFTSFNEVLSATQWIDT